MPTCAEYATALKVGTTRLVLEVLQRGAVPELELEQPVAAIKQLSRDPDFKAVVRLKDGRTLSGLAIQEEYWHAASRACAGSDQMQIGSCVNGRRLSPLAGAGSYAVVGKLDWVTKQWLLETFMREERLTWEDHGSPAWTWNIIT